MAKRRLRSFDEASGLPGRTKFDVLGAKKAKTGKRRTEDAQKAREKTLLVEYRRRGKNNRFVDRRFAQKGDGTEEGGDSSIARFQKERIKQIKKDPRYKLLQGKADTNDPETNVLTHGGKPLDELDDDEIEREAILRAYADEDDGSGALSARETAILNFGGGEDGQPGDERRKTKAEVMSEIIAKSKMYKAIKAKQREDDLNLLQTLDSGFRELMKEGRPMGSKSERNRAAKDVEGATVLGIGAEEEDAYDRSARELVFDMRAKAGERTKTEEEIQAEEEARKERLERQKRKRMDKEESEESGESDVDEGEGNQGTLALDFDHEEDKVLESGSTSTEGSTDGSDEEDAGKSDLEVEEEEEEETAVTQGNLARENGMPSTVGNAMFTTSQIPAEYGAFAKVADGLNATALAPWIQKLRKKDPQTQDERKNMQILYGYLMQYLAHLGGTQPIPSEKIDVLVGPLFEMSAQLPMYAQMVAHSRIVKMQDVHNATLRDDRIRGWPSPQVIVQIKLWCLLFPGSDFAHPVLGPLSLLIGSYLTHCPVVDLQDALTGLLLCGCALQVVRPAKRYFPEAINFLTGILDGSKWQDEQLVSRLEAVRSAPSPPEEEESEAKPTLRSVYEFLSIGRASAFVGGRDAYLELLDKALDTLQSFCALLDDDWGAPELLDDVHASLSALGTIVARPALESKRAALASQLSNWSRSIRAERVRLPVASGVPVTVKKTYNPRFEEDYVRGRDYDVDRERSAMRRLRREFASEAKGAARELKKDNYYLAEQRRREALEASASLRAEQQRNFGMLEQLEADMRSGGQSGGFSQKKGKKQRKG